MLEHGVGSSWWAKGSPWHFTKGLTGKAWSKDLDATTTCASALVSYACQCVPIGSQLTSWCRIKESFVGHELRKSLQLRGSNVILEEEAQYLEHHFAAPLAAYNHALDGLDNPNPDILKGLDKHIKKVGHDLVDLSVKVDTVTSHRMSVLYPKEGKKKQKGPVVPIKERIRLLSNEDWIFAFDPSIWAGYSPFRITEDKDGNPDFKSSAVDYKRRISTIEKQGNDLADLMQRFYLAKIEPNVP
jgi:hypothetical protein